MLKISQLEVVRVDKGGLAINNFLQPEKNGLDTFTFNFVGTADQKFLSKLAKLIESEKDGQTDSTKKHQ